MLETKIAIRSHLGGDCETRTPPFPSRYKERIERLNNISFVGFEFSHEVGIMIRTCYKGTAVQSTAVFDN